MKKKSVEKGITLIALVVTIVVLLILAGISISMLTGENGVINQAKEAKEKTEIGYEKEQVNIAYSSAKSKKIESSDNTPVNADDINEELNVQKADAVASGENPIIVKFNKSKREYEINVNAKTDDDTGYNIYTYNPETGYITGIQEKYLEYVGTALIQSPVKVASLQKKYYIGSSQIIQRKLIKEIGTSLTIPREIDGVQIKGIDDEAFNHIINLEKMIILDNITSIGSFAFWGCIGLTNITISDGVMSIGSKAFDSCSSLINVTIPDSVTSLGSCAFDGCSNLTSITISDGVTSIESHVFSSCVNLTSITIPDRVTSIGYSAFWGCGLTNITIPESVTNIGELAFEGCDRLTTVNYTGTEEQWNAISKADGNTILDSATINYNYNK